MLPFERFKAWQVGYALAVDVHRTTEAFPKREWYGLASQARRAAFSIAANVAEGSAKRGVREFRRFVDIALGSLSELAVIIRLSKDLGYLSAQKADSLSKQREEAGRLTWGLARALKSRHPRS